MSPQKIVAHRFLLRPIDRSGELRVPHITRPTTFLRVAPNAGPERTLRPSTTIMAHG